MQLLRTMITAMLLPAAAAAGAQTTVSTQLIEGAAPAIWSGAVDRGTITHLETGTAFPEELAGMKRFRVVAFGDGGNVAVNYRLGETTFSVIVHRLRDQPALDLPYSIVSLGVRSPQAFLWSDGPFDVAAVPRLRLFKGTYKTGIGPETVMDYLYFGALGRWTVKVRGTLPAPKDVADERRLDDAVRALPWAALLAANGDCTGAACRADRTVPFNSHFGETMLSALLARPAAAVAAPPLFARREGKRDYRVAPLDAKLAGLFTDNFGGLSVSAPLFTLSLQTGDGPAKIVRFFSGTPDRALFDRTVDGLERKPEESAFLSPAAASVYAGE